MVSSSFVLCKTRLLVELVESAYAYVVPSGSFKAMNQSTDFPF